jgi:hypothetical protein
MGGCNSHTAATQALEALPAKWQDKKAFIMKELGPDERFQQALPRPQLGRVAKAGQSRISKECWSESPQAGTDLRQAGDFHKVATRGD